MVGNLFKTLKVVECLDILGLGAGLTHQPKVLEFDNLWMGLDVEHIAPLSLFIPYLSGLVTHWIPLLFPSAAVLMKEISLDYMDVSSSTLSKTLFVNPADRYEEPLCVLAPHYVHFS